jgi:hypothetical protein
MLSYLFDLLFVLLVFAVASFVAWRWSMVHCATTFVSVLMAGLLAITTFEPVANWVEVTYLTSSERFIAKYLYFVVCMTLFLVTLVVLQWCIHAVLPDAPKMSPRAEMLGRWGLGVLTGYLFASFVLCVIMTFPAPRNFWGLFEPDARRRPGPVMASAPDHQFLAFVEYTCGQTSALSGKWLLDRPVIPPDSHTGRWGSFPKRYALWRWQFEYVEWP